MKTDWREPGEPTGGPAMPQMALPTLTPMTKRLLILNGIVFGAWFLVFLVNDTIVTDYLLPGLGLKPDLWREWFPFVPVWQLFTYGFLHDPLSLMHLAGNMLMLYFFGTMLEGILGARRFLVTYLGAQLSGALFYLVTGLLVPLFSAADGLTEPVPMKAAIGASGAVYGILIAAATMRPRQTVVLLFIPITMKMLAIGFLVFALFGMLISFKGADDGVAHMVHLGGIVYGFAAVKLGWVWRDPVQIVEAKRAIRTEERRVDESQEMDRLLEKIHREGMSALTKREKSFLKRVSKK